MSNIWNIKLDFKGQPKISEQSQDFIKSCLQIEEVDRLGWTDIYRHPIFGNRFEIFIEDEQKSNARANYILRQLRIRIHGQNIDLEKLLKKYEKDSEVKAESFNEMLASIEPLLEPKQSKYIFDKFDSNHDGSIETEELKKCLTSSNISLNSLDKHPDLVRHQEQRQVTSVEFEDEETRMWLRITEILDKLRLRLEKKNYDLYQVYQKYDFNKDKLLDIYEFKKLMDKIQNGLTEQEIELCFRRFDLNNDKFISFEEFYRTLCKINGVPSYVGKFAQP